METILRKAADNINKIISSKRHTLLVYADDVDIIGRIMRVVTAMFSKFGKVYTKVGLAVKEDKTKLMVSEVDIPRY